uniref:Uncharacterized protein n=1 Tax=Anguilla anguilla TaxID=7936 RepID=A0A0E9SXN0_ANGAN
MTPVIAWYLVWTLLSLWRPPKPMTCWTLFKGLQMSGSFLKSCQTTPRTLWSASRE